MKKDPEQLGVGFFHCKFFKFCK